MLFFFFPQVVLLLGVIPSSSLACNALYCWSRCSPILSCLLSLFGVFFPPPLFFHYFGGGAHSFAVHLRQCFHATRKCRWQQQQQHEYCTALCAACPFRVARNVIVVPLSSPVRMNASWEVSRALAIVNERRFCFFFFWVYRIAGVQAVQWWWSVDSTFPFHRNGVC